LARQETAELMGRRGY